ncbi:permease prefix domain 1-containing protein [Saccharomonospora sp. NPDC006951]
MNRTDPVADYGAELSSALRGPRRLKARMATDITDGFADTLAAHFAKGTSRADAVRAALREFGTPAEIARSCQRELTIAQARHTAGTLVVTVPLMIAGWRLVHSSANAHPWTLPFAVYPLIVAGGLATLLALLTLAATSRPSGEHPLTPLLPSVMAWTGTIASVAMILAATLLFLAAPLAANWPVIVVATVAAVAFHGLVAASARGCRDCAKLAALTA